MNKFRIAIAVVWATACCNAFIHSSLVLRVQPSLRIPINPILGPISLSARRARYLPIQRPCELPWRDPIRFNEATGSERYTRSALFSTEDEIDIEERTKDDSFNDPNTASPLLVLPYLVLMTVPIAWGTYTPIIKQVRRIGRSERDEAGNGRITRVTILEAIYTSEVY